jgi:hypothetical protein
MAELILEPYAAHLDWQMAGTTDGDSWGRMLAGFLETLAAQCEVDDQSVVGHIKGLCTFPGGEFLRVNVVSASHPADVAGMVPEDCHELRFTLNVLVYGLPYQVVSHCVEETAHRTARQWDASVTVSAIHSHDHEAHHHHHHH